MRRCSRSASVFARFRGGRFVVGSGSSWPHDFLFFTGFDSDCLGKSREKCEADGLDGPVDRPSNGRSSSSGLTNFGASDVGSMLRL